MKIFENHQTRVVFLFAYSFVCLFVLTRELGDLCMLVLQCSTDLCTELGDGSHIGREAIHLIFHLFEIILHLPNSVYEETPDITSDNVI